MSFNLYNTISFKGTLTNELFLKLQTDTPAKSSYVITVMSFWKASARLKNLLPLLLKKSYNFSKYCSIPFSKCWCCSFVSLKHNILLLINAPLLLMSHACFESDLTFSNKIVIASSVTHIFLIFSKMLCWSRSYFCRAETFTQVDDGSNFPTQKTWS